MNFNRPRARPYMQQRTLALLLSAVFASSVMAASTELPPLNDPASSEHHVGKVIWVDLATPDLAGAEHFYGGLFGWTFREIHTRRIDYAVALLDGRPVAGLLQKAIPPGEHRQPAWLTFIAVSDADATTRTALSNGAKILAQARDFSNRGRQAVLADPQGAVFGVLASSSGDPPDFLAAPGEWIWSALLASDPDKDAAFYQALLGYDVFELPSDDGLEHVILSTDDLSRAGINTMPHDSLRRHPHWLNFVRVVDAADAAAHAVALGGRVLVEPRIDRHGGRVAVVADPTGAPVGLMEWSGTDSKREPK
jgi:predicted enzyme related to lactoylglutathione lyase